MTAYRPQFEAALRLFARMSEAMKASGFAAPILVGGGAVELYTLSAVTTGDFDIVTARQEEFEAELRRHGFTKPEGIGHTPLGWVHPELGLGFEVVSATLLDGMADRDRVVLIDPGSDGVATIVSVEDMIADRMGQYASGSAPDMLDQARSLFRLHADADLALWINASATKRQETMASPTSTTDRPIPLAEFAAGIERRRLEAGVVDVSRNSGTRRTPSKRALLAAIEKAGGRW